MAGTKHHLSIGFEQNRNCIQEGVTNEIKGSNGNTV